MCWLEWSWVKCVLRPREWEREWISLSSLSACSLHFMMTELWGLPNSYNNIWLLFIGTFKGTSLSIGQQISEYSVGPGSVHSLFMLGWQIPIN